MTSSPLLGQGGRRCHITTAYYSLHIYIVHQLLQRRNSVLAFLATKWYFNIIYSLLLKQRCCVVVVVVVTAVCSAGRDCREREREPEGVVREREGGGDCNCSLGGWYIIQVPTLKLMIQYLLTYLKTCVILTFCSSTTCIYIQNVVHSSC